MELGATVCGPNREPDCGNCPCRYICMAGKAGTAEKLPVKLRQAAIARKNHPYSALSELAEMMDPPITKPAMNHRLKRLVEYAKEASQ